MDYLNIVLQGYLNENNREFLDKYFYREFKKAEKEYFFEAPEFFSGCLKVVEAFKENIQTKAWERKEELLRMLQGAKNKTLGYRDLQGKTIEQKRKETIEYCNEELENETPYGFKSFGFTVHLMSFTNGKYLNSLGYSEILFIEKNIELAKLKVLENNFSDKKKIFSRQETEIPQPEKTETNSFEFANNFDTVSEADVYNHFKKLVDKKMLTNEELNEYLLKAFQEKTPPKNLFKLNNQRSKREVTKIFHGYYKSIAQSPHGKQNQYVKLLTDYFEGHKFEVTKTNFSK